MSCKEITKESYEATAQAFADKVADLAPIGSIERLMNMLPPNPKIIDIGCGSGRDAKIFTERGVSVVGIDFCPNFIEIARAKAPLAEFQVMDIEQLHFSARTFDGAWAATSLLHIPKKDIPAVLQRIHFILKENGVFYLSLKEGQGEVLENDSRYSGEFKKFWSFFEEEELKKFLQEAHFNILSFERVEKHHNYQSHACFRVFCQKKLVG